MSKGKQGRADDTARDEEARRTTEQIGKRVFTKMGMGTGQGASVERETGGAPGPRRIQRISRPCEVGNSTIQAEWVEVASNRQVRQAPLSFSAADM